MTIMRCHRIRKRIDAYLDGETVSSTQQEQISAHMRVCASCQRHFEKRQQLGALLHGAPQIPLPGGFHDALMVRLRNTEAEDTHRSLRARWAWRLADQPLHRVAALGGVVLMGIVLLAFVLFQGDTVEYDAPSPQIAQALQIDVVYPFEDAVVEPSGFDVTAAFYSLSDVPKPSFSVRVLMDERDVTHVTEVNADYLIYTPDALEPGHHLATVQLLDASGMPALQRSWAFYVLSSSSL